MSRQPELLRIADISAKLEIMITSQNQLSNKKQNPTGISYYNSTGWFLTIVFLGMSVLFHLDLVGNKDLFKDQVGLVVDVGLLNLVHVVLTFLGFMVFNEFNDWYKSTRKTTLHSTLVYLVPLAFLGFGYMAFRESDLFWRVSRTAIRCYGVHHAAFQTYGILLLAGSQSEGWKMKKYFYGLSASYALALVAFEFLQGAERTWVIRLGLLISSVSVLALFYQVRKQREDTHFMVRLLLYPFGMVSPIAGMGISAVHGIEYGLVFNKALKKKTATKSGHSPRVWAFMVLFVAFAMICFLGLRNTTFSIWGDIKNFSSLPLGLIAVWLIIDYANIMHYYFDSLMFRMKSQAARANILPLIR